MPIDKIKPKSKLIVWQIELTGKMRFFKISSFMGGPKWLPLPTVAVISIKHVN